MAYRYKLENEEMKKFLYQNEELWQEILDHIIELKEDWNVFLFVETVFKSNFRRFWDSYRSDYMDTLIHWTMTGAFEGDKRELSRGFWEDLEKRLERNEFILRTAEPY